MKYLRVTIALASVLLAGCLAPTPAQVVTPPPPPRALEVHTCVPSASVWIDGAGEPSPPTKYTADANGVVALPAIPSNEPAFNLHATAPNYPEYGVVVQTASPPGGRIVVYLGSCSK